MNPVERIGEEEENKTLPGTQAKGEFPKSLTQRSQNIPKKDEYSKGSQSQTDNQHRASQSKGWTHPIPTKVSEEVMK